MIALLGVPIILGLFPGLWLIATVAVAFVGWLNRGDIHAREHVLDMLPWMITAIAIVFLLSIAR